MTSLLILGQVVLGLYFIMNGINHFKNAAGTAGYAQSRGLAGGKALVYLSGLVMLLGGLGVLLGMYVTLSLWGLIAFLVLAAFLIHHFWTDEDQGQRASEKVNFMKNLALAGALLMLTALASNWPWSVGL